MALLGLLLVTVTVPASSQRVSPGLVEWQAPELAWQPTPATRSAAENQYAGRKILGGVLGGAAGFFVGGFLGVQIADSESCYDWCGLIGAIIGASLLESIGLGLGLEVADPGEPKLLRRILLPTLVGGAGLLAAAVAESALPLLLVVPLQFVVAW